MSHPMGSDERCQLEAQEEKRRKARNEARYLLLAEEFEALVRAAQDGSIGKLELGERINILIRRVVP